MPEPRAVLAALLLWLGCGAATAGIADASGDALQAALITYGPGDIYWERFGHDAIEIRDTTSGESIAFNYGMFDFSQDNFLLNFARGRMRYTMDAVPSADDIAFYAGEGRSVRRQVLALAPAQVAALRDALLVNLQPKNAPYDYDYFRANCATRVRDALDTALDGKLRTAWQGTAVAQTLRSETNRLMAPQAWLMLLIDLGLGPDADRPLDQWQADFVPMTLADAITGIEITDGDGNARPLVTTDQRLVASRLPAPPMHAPDWRCRFLLAGLLLGTLLAVSGRQRQNPTWRRTHTVIATVFASLAGVAGVVMALLWLGTAHQAAWGNQNLLLFNPLALALLPLLWRSRPAKRRAISLALLLFVLAAAALLGKPFLPPQQNLAWIALALPAWCGLFAGTWPRRNEPSR